MHEDRERAKAIILEIIRQAGGRLQNKTNLFKAFYHAHLEFARTQPGYLSNWPIVHMPNGPGIDNCDRLLGELCATGLLTIKPITTGDYEGFLFVTAASLSEPSDLPEGAIEAIRAAVAFVQNKTAKVVSMESHRRAWDSTTNGQEMEIYVDLQSEAEYCERKSLYGKLGPMVDEVFGS